MNQNLYKHNWRTADEAMAAVIGTMRGLLNETPPMIEWLGGERHDNTATAKELLDKIEDLWGSELSLIVWNRLV